MDDNEWDGLIVALDQEKVSNKIRHDYMWEVLRKTNLPERFINTVNVKEMYKGAKSSVMINSFLSSPFDVNRGICQGDPLSCLLFNLAIEPLAQMIRTSPLEGLKIPKIKRSLKPSSLLMIQLSFSPAKTPMMHSWKSLINGV
jgi:hypothetical protein